MGSACCKQGMAVEEVLTDQHLNCKLVRERQTDFHDRYEIVEVIGEGSISKISKIKRKDVPEAPLESKELANPSDHYYALKEIHTGVIDPALLAEMNNEIDLLKRLVRFLLNNLPSKPYSIPHNTCFAAHHDIGSPQHSQGVRNIQVEG